MRVAISWQQVWGREGESVFSCHLVILSCRHLVIYFLTTSVREGLWECVLMSSCHLAILSSISWQQVWGWECVNMFSCVVLIPPRKTHNKSAKYPELPDLVTWVSNCRSGNFLKNWRHPISENRTNKTARHLDYGQSTPIELCSVLCGVLLLLKNKNVMFFFT